MKIWPAKPCFPRRPRLRGLNPRKIAVRASGLFRGKSVLYGFAVGDAAGRLGADAGERVAETRRDFGALFARRCVA